MTRRLTALVAVLSCGAPTHGQAQHAPDRVLVRTADAGPEGRLAVDRGSALLWHQLQKLQTTASVLYTAGHPDDEEAGVLTLLSRGMGVRTALLTLNRGEGGANAIGPELFDALGLIRTEELRLAGRYYGLDDQYFTTAVDYGYSKTLAEAMRSWDPEAIVGDMVRVIRANRPLVVISRWHGSPRDGHGHHQAAGVLTPEAVVAAADPTRFPEQITEEGLRPWRVARLYRGRLLAEETHDAELNPHLRSPWLGESYQSFGARGLSLQRSQTAGRQRGSRGPPLPARYELLEPAYATGAVDPIASGADGTAGAGGGRAEVDADRGGRAGGGGRTAAAGAGAGAAAAAGVGAGAGAGEVSGGPAASAPPGVFDALDTSIGGLRSLVPAGPDEAGIAIGISEIARHLARASDAFDATNPAAVVPDLVVAIESLRSVRETDGLDDELDFLLAIKERQIADALGTATGLDIGAVATPRGSAPTTPMGPATPTQTLDVHVTIAPGEVEALLIDLELRSREGWIPTTWGDRPAQSLAAGAMEKLALVVPADAEPTRPWFYRPDIRLNQYLVRDSAEIHLGESRAGAEVVATFEVAGTRFNTVVPVVTLESNAPYGVLRRPLQVAPPVSVRVDPGIALRPVDGRITAVVEVTSNAPSRVATTVSLELPVGWTSEPESHDVTFTAAGESARVSFDVPVPGDPAQSVDGPMVIRAVATAGSRTYGEGHETIEHRDLRVQRLYGQAELHFYGFDAGLPEGLRVGYVMGVGDEVPAAIEQLGASVTLLDAAAMTGGVLGEFDAIVVGTRAYAVRPDLVANNGRLLDYARAGGNLVVLYQTPEYEPEHQAPFPASLPANAEETSEEDAPVSLLAPTHALLTTPNRLDADTFEGWVEQRGSKFFSTWAEEYTPLIETHDSGQPPQRGVWLTAPVGDGHFTYVALALHRQVPYGVPGAYRILANLLTLGR